MLCHGVYHRLAVHRPSGRESLRLFLATGMLGGFTTFSAFSLETFQFIQDGRWGLALLYVLLTAVGCLLGVSLGNGTASLLS